MQQLTENQSKDDASRQAPKLKRADSARSSARITLNVRAPSCLFRVGAELGEGLRQFGMVAGIDIEGHPDTPHTLGRLCPKGAATIQLSNNPLRPTKAMYRAPGSDKWEEKPLDWMYEQIAKRYYDTREKYFIEKEKNKDGQEVVVNRLDAIASLGSACIDNEECYLLSKLNRTFGIVYHEHQARV